LLPERALFRNFSVTQNVATEHTSLSERERQAVEQVAEQRGISFDEAVELMAKEGLAARIRKKTGRAPAKVFQLPTNRRT
jgi:predicted kinase